MTNNSNTCQCKRNHHSHTTIWLVLWFTILGLFDCSGESNKIKRLESGVSNLKLEIDHLKLK